MGGKTSAAVKNRWAAKALDQLRIEPRKEYGAAIRAAAAAAEESVNGYVLEAVKRRMISEGQPLTVPITEPDAPTEQTE